MSFIRKKAIEGLRVGDVFTAERTFDASEIPVFADITRDYNPIHFDERFTDTKKFKGKILHGLLVASIVTEIGGQIGWLASRMDFRFKKPVYPNDTITCRTEIVQMDEKGRSVAEIVMTNQEGVVVLEATLEGIVPQEAERRVMAAMTQEGDPSNKIR